MNVTQDASLVAAKTRLTNARAAQAEIKLRIMMGEYVPAKEIAARQAEEVSRVRAKMLALPSKLARRMAGKILNVNEVDAILTEAITEALYELSTTTK